MPRLAISFKSSDAAAEWLEGMVKEMRERGNSSVEIEDNNCGESLALEIVDEGQDEFEKPVFELR